MILYLIISEQSVNQAKRFFMSFPMNFIFSRTISTKKQGWLVQIQIIGKNKI